MRAWSHNYVEVTSLLYSWLGYIIIILLVSKTTPTTYICASYLCSPFKLLSRFVPTKNRRQSLISIVPLPVVTRSLQNIQYDHLLRQVGWQGRNYSLLSCISLVPPQEIEYVHYSYVSVNYSSIPGCKIQLGCILPKWQRVCSLFVR